MIFDQFYLLYRNRDDTDDIHITDSSMESSPSQSPSHPIPQTSSTPHKDSAQKNVHSHSEWLVNTNKSEKVTRGLYMLKCNILNALSFWLVHILIWFEGVKFQSMI